jgi:Thioredoxin domain-containing protein
MLANCYLKINEVDLAKEILSNIESPDKEKNQDFMSAKSGIEIFEKAQDNEIVDTDITDLEKKLEKNPDNHETRFNIAISLMGKGKYENAIEHFLYIIEKDRMWNDEAPRKNLLEIFNALGPADELAIEGRKKLSSILFS